LIVVVKVLKLLMADERVNVSDEDNEALKNARDRGHTEVSSLFFSSSSSSSCLIHHFLLPLQYLPVPFISSFQVVNFIEEYLKAKPQPKVARAPSIILTLGNEERELKVPEVELEVEKNQKLKIDVPLAAPVVQITEVPSNEKKGKKEEGNNEEEKVQEQGPSDEKEEKKEGKKEEEKDQEKPEEVAEEERKKVQSPFSLFRFPYVSFLSFFLGDYEEVSKEGGCKMGFCRR